MASVFTDDEEEQAPTIGSALAGDDDEEQTGGQAAPAPKTAPQAALPSQDAETAQMANFESDEESGSQQQPQAAAVGNGSVADEDAGAPPAGIKAPSLPATPHYQDNSGNYAALEHQMATFNPDDYKPSVGRRIAAAVAGFTGGFARSPQAVEAAENINSQPLRSAQARQQAAVAPINQRIADANAQNQQERQKYADASSQYGMQERDLTNQARIADWQAQAQQRREQNEAKLNTVDKNTLGPVDPNNPFGEWQGRTPSGQVVRGLEPPAAIQKSPKYQFQQRQQEINDMVKSGIKLTRDEAKYYLVNGKLAEPKADTHIHIPSAEAEKYNDWKTAFQRENGRAPNAAETAGFGHASAGGAASKSLFDRIESNKGAAFAKAQSNFALMNNPGEYQGDLQAAQNEYEQRLEDATGQPIPHVAIKVDPATGAVDWGGAQAQKPAAAVPAQGAPTQQSSAPQPAAQQPAGTQQPVVIRAGNGQQLTDQDLARQYLQKAGGDKNKARQLAQQDNWKF